MVREHRLLTVKKGINRIQFSWANTLIDPTSIDFRILDKVDQVELIDTTFPAGREDIEDGEPKRLVSMKVVDAPLECIYKLTDRDGGQQFTKFYRFKNLKLLGDDGTEKDLPTMENLGLSPLPDGMVRLFYEEEIVSGKPVAAEAELERRFDANVVLWSEDAPPADWNSNEPGAYVDLHAVPGRKERVDANHAKYFLDLNPGEKTFVRYSVTYRHRKMGPELNTEKRREPL